MRPAPKVRGRSARAALVLLVALAIAALLSASAQAATYTVGDAKDVPGTCANPAGGTCSLRQLIDYEDKLATTPNPTDTIVVPAGTYALANGELEITQSLSIEGAGARTTHVELPAGASTARAFSVKIPAEGKTPSVLISGLEISGGTAGENNGYFGGDVYNAGELTLAEDWITGGTASSGGGVSNDTGTLVVDRSLVSGNVASTGGGDSGGIQNHGSAVCVRACTPGKRGVLTVDDSTVAYNEARLGAGIFSWSDDGVADENLVTVIDSTIAYNTAKEETEGPARGLGAGLLINAGTADVAGSILAYNAEIDEEGEYVATDCSTTSPGTIHSDGYNLENDADCGFTAKGDLEETFPDFTSAEPQNNGGATNTLGLEATSPGVDAIPKGNPYCVGTDQRGVTRPQGAACAMGAYELVPFTIEAVEGSKFSGELATARCGIFGTPTIEWGDGKSSKATVTESEISGTHTYEEAGTYNGFVDYEDDCGTYKVPFQARVADAPLSATGEAVNGTVGVQFSGTVAKFTDANPDGKVSQYTASINWGDGSSASAGTIKAAEGGGFLVSGSHTYAAVGTYPVTVTIKDVGGSEAVASGSAKITGPPVISEVKAASVTETTAKVEFKLAPEGLETTYEVEYGLTESYGQKSASAKLAGTAGPTREAVTLSGLKAGSTYHFRVVAKNAQAPTGVHSEDKTFATLGPPVISEVGAAAITETSAKIEFTLAPAGAETTYEVEYGLTEAYGQKSAPAKLAGAAGPTRESVTLSGLKAHSTYHFRVVAKNAQAPGGVASADMTFVTLGPPVISEVTSGSVAETSAKVEFTLASEGSETTFEVEYGPTEAYGSKSASAKLAGTAGPTHEAVTLSGLKADSAYHFRVVAKNAQAPAGVHSADGKFTTLGPPAISEVSVGSITETTANVGFTLDPAGSETTYEVEYGPTEGYGQTSGPAKLAAGAGPTHETVTLSGLQADSTFYFRVVATNSQAKTGVKSAVEHFTTEPQSGPGAGGTGSPSGQQGVSGFQSSSTGGATLGSLPPPVLGVNVNVDVVSGKVFVAYPLGSQLASLSDVLEASLASPLRAIESLSKGLHFVPLTEARQIPVGSVLETTAGVARIETATASINKPQFGNFGAGIFKLLQARKQKGLTELDIMDAHSTRQVCASLGKRAAVAAKLSSKVLGRLNANAHGKFTTKGQYSAATVRGTVWNVANQCDGTLTKVQRGVVSVRDFVRRKTITLFTGQHYLARP
jgi:hypothetical protein